MMAPGQQEKPKPDAKRFDRIYLQGNYCTIGVNPQVAYHQDNINRWHASVSFKPELSLRNDLSDDNFRKGVSKLLPRTNAQGVVTLDVLLNGEGRSKAQRKIRQVIEISYAAALGYSPYHQQVHANAGKAQHLKRPGDPPYL